MNGRLPLVRSKVRVPPLGPASVPRPRVVDALARAARDRSILLVVAPAGSGKTTALAQLVAHRGGPAAWLSLGDGDGSPGRFLAYLAAATAAIDAAAADRTRRYLADGLEPETAAALLGEGLPPGATVVLDDVHQVEASAPALRVLRAFLDTLDPAVLVVLAARRLLALDLARDVLTGRVGALEEAHLAFTRDEIAGLLAARGLQGSAAGIEAASGGWAAGVVFEALRGPQRDPATPGTGDPFFAYLGSEVLGALPAGLRAVVVRAALLDHLSPSRLHALLGIPAADEVYAAICAHHLPGTPEPDGLRLHPRFREFLLATLRREAPQEVGALTARLGHALMRDGHAEEAADALLRAGALDAAAGAMAAAAPDLMLRGDFEKVTRWCAALGDRGLAGRPALRGAQVRAMMMSRRQGEVAGLVRTMHASGELAGLVQAAPDVAAAAVWALHAGGEWDRMLALAPPAASCRRARVMRYVLETGTGAGPPAPFGPGELDGPWPLHVALEATLYYRGRFADVERLAWAAAARGPVTATLADIYRVGVLTARRDLAEARAVLDAAAPRVRATRFIEFWQQMEAELAFAEGRREEGLLLIRRARVTSRRHGYPVGDRAVFAAIEGRMLTRMDRLPEAVEALRAARAWCAARGLRCFGEWAETWLGAALLRLGDDGARARRLLAPAAAAMERAGRRLHLPAAYVMLAEAHWRSGDEAAHDRAADAAYAASVAMGSLGPLLTALDDQPDVLARRLDAGGRGEGAWRSLARAAAPSAAPVPMARARLVVRTLGRPALEADGAEVPVAPAKAVELAALVAAAGPLGAARADLVGELMEASADGHNYLRQLVHRIRRALPPGLALASAGDRLAFAPAGAVAAEDQVLEGLLARAGREVGDARLATLAEALALADRGPYLPQVDGEAARHRREAVAGLVAEGRREYARALMAAGRAPEAAGAARAAVVAEPYREDGWRMLMRIEAAAGGPAAAVPAFLDCARALRQVGLEPTAETLHLLARLREA